MLTKQGTCLLPGCEKRLSARWHFCKAHWALVPAVLQGALAKTWRLYQAPEPFNSLANEQHAKQWQLARGVAVVAVQAALGQIEVPEHSRGTHV